MHYLNELAGKLVATYQDRENLSLWISGQGQDNHQAIVTALRAVLEQEVAQGHLRYVCPPNEIDRRPDAGRNHQRPAVELAATNT
jgi:hypothetical protein